MPESDARKMERLPFAEAVQLRRPHRISVMGIDIGAGGIGVQSPLALEAGTSVELELFGGRAIFLGTVRWVRPVADGYRVGIQFRDEDWSVIERVQQLRARM